MSSVTKLSVDLLDLPAISFEELPHDAIMPIYVPRGDGTYRSVAVTLGWIQTLFNNGAPGGDTLTVIDGGEVEDSVYEIVDGGEMEDDVTRVFDGGEVIP